jgi:hypothetical protein
LISTGDIRPGTDMLARMADGQAAAAEDHPLAMNDIGGDDRERQRQILDLPLPR